MLSGILTKIGDMMSRLFISYSHEDKLHNQWVLKLAHELQEKKIETHIDQLDLKLGDDMGKYMEEQVVKANHIIIVCTPLYCKKSNDLKGGVGYEKSIISAELIKAEPMSRKCIPILRKGSFDDAIPIYLSNKFAGDFKDDKNFDKSFKRLLEAIQIVSSTDKSIQTNAKKPNGNTVDEEKGKTLKKPQILESLNMMVRTQALKDFDSRVIVKFSSLEQRERAKSGSNPFTNGYWQMSFIIDHLPEESNLRNTLSNLCMSVQGLRDWFVLVPESGPYPYDKGIEFWYAEEGDSEPGSAMFWRFEPQGKFSIVRGYFEDNSDFKETYRLEEDKYLDFRLIIWRITELLLFIQGLSRNIGSKDSTVKIKINWNGLEGRRLVNAEGIFKHSHKQNRSFQNSHSTILDIENCKDIDNSLVSYVHTATNA